MQTAQAGSLEPRVVRKIAWRLLPLAILGYIVAYVDRSNISFAALTMNKDLGFTPYVYGLGAGIFFIGYLLFEIPSNLIMARTGARLWIARILFTWGIASALTAFITGPLSFYGVRFLIGVAEAGFLPGIVLYFTYWFPARYRARVFAGLYVAQPVANAVAALASGAILGMDGFLGLRGWQWVFLLEALPALLLALVVLRAMTDRPAAATWLADDEKAWLERTLAAEHRAAGSAGDRSWIQACLDPRTLALTVIWFGTVTANYGVVFFMPQILKGLQASNFMTGVLSAIPYVVGIVGLLLWGWSSDRLNERRWHLIVACILCSVGLVGAGWFGASYWAVVAMSVSMIGLFGTRAVFWAMPAAFLTGTSAAAAFAFINSVSQIGGYVGPFVVGWIKDGTGSFESALYFLAACSLLSAVVAVFARRAASGRAETTQDALPAGPHCTGPMARPTT
ncbi:MAG TPA: MFS transporter [Stellaceae bacterium]|nr:MFS transporter [Stellaceae bacterium]